LGNRNLLKGAEQLLFLFGGVEVQVSGQTIVLLHCFGTEANLIGPELLLLSN
jgi:hypothetical protein